MPSNWELCDVSASGFVLQTESQETFVFKTLPFTFNMVCKANTYIFGYFYFYADMNTCISIWQVLKIRTSTLHSQCIQLRFVICNSLWIVNNRYLLVTWDWSNGWKYILMNTYLFRHYRDFLFVFLVFHIHMPLLFSFMIMFSLIHYSLAVSTQNLFLKVLLNILVV